MYVCQSQSPNSSHPPVSILKGNFSIILHLYPANRLEHILGKSTFPFSEDQSGSREFLQTCVTCLLSSLRIISCPWVSDLYHILGASSLVNAATCPQQEEEEQGWGLPRGSGKNDFSIFLNAYF